MVKSGRGGFTDEVRKKVIQQLQEDLQGYKTMDDLQGKGLLKMIKNASSGIRRFLDMPLRYERFLINLKI
jgi:hypothetical protein